MADANRHSIEVCNNSGTAGPIKLGEGWYQFLLLNGIDLKGIQRNSKLPPLPRYWDCCSILLGVTSDVRTAIRGIPKVAVTQNANDSEQWDSRRSTALLLESSNKRLLIKLRVV